MKLIDILKAANIPRNSSGLLGTFESGLLSVRKSGSKTFIKYHRKSVGNVALDFLATYFQVSLGEVITIRDYVWAEVYDEHTRTVNTSVTIKKKECEIGLTNQLFVSEASSHKFDSELMQKWYDAYTANENSSVVINVSKDRSKSNCGSCKIWADHHAKLRNANNTVLSITKEQDKPMNTSKPTQEQRLARALKKAREYGLRYDMDTGSMQRIVTSIVEVFYKAEEEHAQKLEAEKAKLVFTRDMAESCRKQENKKLHDLCIQLSELNAEIDQTKAAALSHSIEANRLSKELADLQKQE